MVSTDGEEAAMSMAERSVVSKPTNPAASRRLVKPPATPAGIRSTGPNGSSRIADGPSADAAEQQADGIAGRIGADAIVGLRSDASPTGDLAPAVRRHFETRFGRDFSQVRVRADSGAAELAAAYGARAFTSGREITFGSGEYRPETIPGRRLIAHELAHVAQQSSTSLRGVIQRKPNPAPTWSTEDSKKIQRQLIRLGLLLSTADGTIGDDSQSALVEAFGDESWRTQTAPVVLSQLTTAKPPPGTKGEHRLRWGEMFKDGVLDMTLGVGFDEGKPGATDPLANQTRARDEFVIDLTGRGFVEDAKLAQRSTPRPGEP